MNFSLRCSHAIVLIIAAIFLVTGCRPAFSQISPSETEAAFTPLPAPSLSPTLTRTLKPTSTRVKTATPTTTPLPMTETFRALAMGMQKTNEYRLDVEIPATLEARGVECREGFVLEQQYDIIRQSTSEWTMFTCSPILENAADWQTPGAVDYGSRYTQFTRTDHSQTWIITHGSYQGMLYNRSQALVTAERWTKNGQYVYFYPSFYSAPSGFSTADYYFRLFSLALFRLNLEMGEVETIIPYNKTSHSFSISPNDRYLIYAQRIQPEVIHLVDLVTLEETLIELDDGLIATGRFSWNLDSSKVAFGAAYPKESEDWRDDVAATSIYLLTIENLRLETIIDQDPRVLMPFPWYGCEDQAWLDENRICVISYGEEFSKIYILGLKSGSIMPYGTPTPSSTPKSPLTPTP